MYVRGLGTLIPHWVYVWLMIGAFLALLCKAPRVALGFAALPLLHWFVVPVIGVAISNLPPWIQIPIEATIFFIIILLVMYSIITLIFGRGVADMVIGQILSKAVGTVFYWLPTLPRGLERLFSSKQVSRALPDDPNADDTGLHTEVSSPKEMASNSTQQHSGKQDSVASNLQCEDEPKTQDALNSGAMQDPSNVVDSSSTIPSDAPHTPELSEISAPNSAPESSYSSHSRVSRSLETNEEETPSKVTKNNSSGELIETPSTPEFTKLNNQDKFSKHSQSGDT